MSHLNLFTFRQRIDACHNQTVIAQAREQLLCLGLVTLRQERLQWNPLSRVAVFVLAGCVLLQPSETQEDVADSVLVLGGQVAIYGLRCLGDCLLHTAECAVLGGSQPAAVAAFP